MGGWVPFQRNGRRDVCRYRVARDMRRRRRILGALIASPLDRGLFVGRATELETYTQNGGGTSFSRFSYSRRSTCENCCNAIATFCCDPKTLISSNENVMLVDNSPISLIYSSTPVLITGFHTNCRCRTISSYVVSNLLYWTQSAYHIPQHTPSRPSHTPIRSRTSRDRASRGIPAGDVRCVDSDRALARI